MKSATSLPNSGRDLKHRWWATLPARDLVLLPLLSLSTIAVMFSFAEMASRHFWPDPQFDTCVIWEGPIGPHMQPNCVSYERVPESPSIRNVYNACGYRSLAACGPKPAGTIRIAVLGSSAAEALLVPMDETYAELAARHLQDLCHCSVEVQEIAAPLSSPYNSLERVDEALRLQPDAVLFMLTPMDLEALLYEGADAKKWARSVKGGGVGANTGIYKRLQIALLSSRTALVLEHYFFQNPDVYARFYLLYGDKADFLRQPFTRAWEQRFQDLDYITGRMAARLNAAGVPLFVAAAPSRADASLMASSKRSRAIDPYAWGDRIRGIAAAHRAHYVDLLRAFGETPHSDSFCFVVDGHLNADAQPLISRALVHALLAADIPAFSSCRAKNRSS
ncbi:MAG: hypothetical protein JO319_14115 [Acidobacteriaceae bacterium]|nr:hypothetical protein [Acidobacteriaceae bacterium]